MRIPVELSLSLYSKPRNNSKYRFTCNKVRPSFAKIYYNRTVLNFKQIVKIRRIYFPYGRYKTIGQKKRKKLFLYSANENTVEASLDRSSSKMNLSICLKASSGSAGFFIRRLTISRGNPLSREPIANRSLRQTCLPPSRSSPVGLNRVSSSGLPVDTQLSARRKNRWPAGRRNLPRIYFPHMLRSARASPCVYTHNLKE